MHNYDTYSNSRRERTILRMDDNIGELRKKYPNGLHFVVGDTHGQVETLIKLMKKIEFDPQKDHVCFVGDYNGGGRVDCLLSYIAQFYNPEHDGPGFHIIRGNHERELYPIYMLEQHPDIMVIRGKTLIFYIVHSGMVSAALRLLNKDIEENPDKKVFAYKLDDCTTVYDAPLRPVIWSRNGLYTQKTRRWWPTEAELSENKACVIHGHAPYCFFLHENYISYGDNSLFWQNQHIFFSESLQSFNIDSNVKGRMKNGEFYRGLSCVCLEMIDEIAADNEGKLTIDGVISAPNFVFSEILSEVSTPYIGGISRIIEARPEMKTITLDENMNPVFMD